MSNPPENSASQESIYDFDVCMVLGILNTPDLSPIHSIGEPLGHSSGPTTSILSSAWSNLLFGLNESKKSRTETLRG